MSITIGKAIFTILSGNTAVKNYVGTKIYPLIIPENTNLPCIVYERNSDVEFTKDGYGISDSSIDVTILSEDYTECIEITLTVFAALNLYQGTVAGHQIIDIRLTGVSETFAEDCYIQKLSFNCKSI